jgi:hypothetical protein
MRKPKNAKIKYQQIALSLPLTANRRKNKKFSHVGHAGKGDNVKK